MSVTALLILTLACPTSAARDPVVVGSKTFTESYLLAEIMSQLLEARGYAVDRRHGLGGTLICFEALQAGEIDVYPEYTGTLREAILTTPEDVPLARALAAQGLAGAGNFGFNNTYALALKASLAEARGIGSVADLVAHPDLVVAVSHEFLSRGDGWPGLASAYGLPHVPDGIEHGLAYRAIDTGDIDITDAYSTDGDLGRYRLTTLAEPLGYFPEYQALPLLRADFDAEVRGVLGELAGRLDETRMRALNARVVVDGETFAVVASDFLVAENLVREEDLVRADNSLADELARNTIRHLQLTVSALFLACAFGLPLAFVAFRSERASQFLLYVAGLLQTIPSIALLALMIPLLGIGVVPAIAALFLYSLLPILRNTITALVTIDPALRRVAVAIGLTGWQQMRFLLIPMAMPNILAGIRTAAVISVGKTLAAFIGAGGLGDPIVTGLNLNDTGLILRGAVPAAALALATELLFELLERILVPRT